MADPPKGFVIDNGSSKLPSGFVIDPTPQEKQQPVMLDEAVQQRQAAAVQGIKRGIISGLGLPGDITKFLGGLFGVEDKDRALPTSAEVAAGAEKYLGVEPPKGPSDKVVEFLANPASYLGGGSLGSKVVGATLGGVGADIGERVGGPVGEVIGGVIGGVTGVGATGQRVMAGLNTPANRAAAANVLAREGVEVSAGQQTGKAGLRKLESQTGQAPFSGDVAQEQFGRQTRQFTRAALRRIGENADEATPTVINRAFDRIGKDFDRLQQNVLLPDQNLKDEIAAANQEYINATSPGTRSEYAQRIADQIESLPTSIGVPGKAYKNLRSEINRVMRKTTDPAYKGVLRDYQDALDDAMERTLKQTNPAELGKFQVARRQYRNLLVIEKAATRAGEAAREGLITPQNLRSAVVGQSRRDFARGRGDFADLAAAGEMLMTAPKSSGTAENLMYAHPISYLLHAPTGLTGRALHSRLIQDILKGSRAIPGVTQEMPSQGVRSLINVLGDQNAPQ